MHGDRNSCRPFSLTVDSIPLAARIAAAERFGVSLVAENQASLGTQSGEGRPAAGKARRVIEAVLLAGVESTSLEMALIGSYDAFIEVADPAARRDDLDIDDTVWAAASLHPFFLSLTTETLVSVRGAMVICNTLVARGILGREQRANVELCLQEAVANAVVHGNLGVPSNAKRQEHGYRAFSHMIGERLHVPELRRRRVDIFARWDAQHITLGVADQGSGYDLDALRRVRHESRRSPSGRGFLFMQALADAVDIGDGGRRIALRFSRTGAKLAMAETQNR